MSIAESTQATSLIQFTVKPGFSVFSGYTKFVMDLRVQWETGGIGDLKSELEFPLDVTMAGVQVGIGSAPHIRDDWAVLVGYYTNTGDPDELMTDGDWRYDPTPGSINGQFSYTESHVSMEATLFTIEARKALINREKYIIGVTAEYRYQKFAQDILDFHGWYIDDAGQQFEQGYEGLSLTYEVIYKMPAGGFYLTYRPANTVAVTGRLLGTIVSAKDIDDHILRNRLATADGTGPGVIGGLSARFNFGGATHRMKPFIEADAEFVSLSVKTNGDLYWYGDDPITTEDDTGTELHNIPHHFTSRQAQLRLRAGISF